MLLNIEITNKGGLKNGARLVYNGIVAKSLKNIGKVFAGGQ